jgi:hypothetical protein
MHILLIEVHLVIHTCLSSNILPLVVILLMRIGIGASIDLGGAFGVILFTVGCLIIYVYLYSIISTT